MVRLGSLCKVLGVLRKMISNGSWGSRKVGKSKVITRLDFCHWKTDSRANSLLTKLCWKGRDRGRFSSSPFCFIWKIVKYASVNSIRGWMQWEKVAADWDVTVGAKKPHQVARSKLNSKRDKRAKKLRFQTYMSGRYLFWWGPNDLLNKDFDEGNWETSTWREVFQSDGEYLVGRGW